MRVILLAGGMSARLLPLHENTPKCLLDVGGRTIVSRAVGALVAHGLRRFTIVDGFLGDHVRADVLAEFPAEWFEFVRNEHHATTGDAHALLLARGEVPEPILLVQSHLVFDRRVVGRMLAKGPPDRAAVRVDPITGARTAVGLHVLSAETATALFQVLHRRVRDERRVGEGYEVALAEVIRDGAALHPIDLRELSCVAVDSRDDLHRARRLFGPPQAIQSSKPESITTSHSFFGGPDSTAPSTGK